MSDRAASSSDLSYARALSARLSRGDTSAPPADTPTGAPTFTRLGAAVAVAPSPPPAAAPTTVASWDELLEWAAARQPCEAVFVVDPEGFVIANRGHLDHSELEGLGPQFQELAAKASRIEAGTARVVSLKLDRGWLSGLRFDRGHGRFFLLGLIAAEPLTSAAEAALSAQVEHNLGHL